MLTPVHYNKKLELHIKRDDLFTIAGIQGGKARTCAFLAQNSKVGLVTAGSRKSPQAIIVAAIARSMNLPCNVHVPSGADTPEIEAARGYGATVIKHKPGYNTVIIARAREDAAATGFTLIPFGMECWEAVTQTKAQVENLKNHNFKRIVVPVGSGMSLAGVLRGMLQYRIYKPVLGICVGADPHKRLLTYASSVMFQHLTLIKSKVDYHKNSSNRLGDLLVDPVYEAKCIPFLEKGDLLWIVGIRPGVTEVKEKE